MTEDRGQAAVADFGRPQTLLHATTTHDGLPQGKIYEKRKEKKKKTEKLKEDLCRGVPRVPKTTQPVT